MVLLAGFAILRASEQIQILTSACTPLPSYSVVLRCSLDSGGVINKVINNTWTPIIFSYFILFIFPSPVGLPHALAYARTALAEQRAQFSQKWRRQPLSVRKCDDHNSVPPVGTFGRNCSSAAASIHYRCSWRISQLCPRHAIMWRSVNCSV